MAMTLKSLPSLGAFRIARILLPVTVLLFITLVYFRENLDLSIQPDPFAAINDPFNRTRTGEYHTHPPALPADGDDDEIVDESPSEPVGAYVHIEHPNGLMEVSPYGPHPIFRLMAEAEAKWERKLSQASKTLEEAVTEYRRRYRRMPPRGFDKWWKYVVDHNVQLPDEYDQIFEDLEPFWGMAPWDVQRFAGERERDRNMVTLGKSESTDGQVRLLLVSGEDASGADDPDILRSAWDVLENLKDVAEDLPEFRMVVSSFDNPEFVREYGLRKALTDAAAVGEVIMSTEYPSPQHLRWLSACPPSSPARQSPDTYVPTINSTSKTFIHNHKAVMDPCYHPNLLNIHGQFIGQSGEAPISHAPISPRFSYCSTTLHNDIRLASGLNWEERSDDPEWDDKQDHRLSWRGTNTGIWHAHDKPWRDAQRARLVDFANNVTGTVKVLFPPTGSRGEGESNRLLPVGDGVEIERGRLNPAVMDIAFAGAPLGCAPDVCPLLSEIWDWRKFQSHKEACQFRYIMDIDGNAWSSRFKRLVTSNSLIFKSTIYPEWFTDRIQPWVHYVPIQMDLSDLYDALLFFRGGLYGEGSQSESARRIASAGRQWSKRFWRKEDLTAYTYRLVLEFARVTSTDRDSMTFAYQGQT